MSSSPDKDNQDVEDNKELLTSMGKLSLNVKAVPYIPKQDGGSQSHLGNEPSGETGYEKNGSSSEESQNDQVRFSLFCVILFFSGLAMFA